MEAAKLRLACARNNALLFKHSLKLAHAQYSHSHEEVKAATEFLAGVEKKWGVIDVDIANDDNSNLTDESSAQCNGSNDAVPRLDLANASDVSTSTSRIFMQQIEIKNSGEPLVNGSYQIGCSPSSNSTTNSTPFMNSSETPIYVHSSGPIPLNGEYHDVVVYKKDGYGDKVRWCVALVPCIDYDPDISENDNTVANNSPNGCDTIDHDNIDNRRRNFSRAYIYYWVEIPAYSSEAHQPPRDGWRVCHGESPLPVLKEGHKGNGNGWWQYLQFWNWNWDV